MAGFRILMGLIFITIVTYTVIVVPQHGLNFLPDFIGDIKALAWPGQFNVDFMSYLLLSGLWIAWRHDFSPLGLVLALVVSPGGMLLFAPYVLIASFKAQGDMRVLLLGLHRAQA